MLRRIALVCATAMVAAGPVLVVSPQAAHAQSSGKVRVTDAGFTFVPGAPDDAFAGEVTAGAVVENPTAKVATDVTVTLTLQDERGKAIIDSDKTLAYIAPGDEAYVAWETTYPETDVPTKVQAKITDPGQLVSPAAWARDAQFELGVGEFGAEEPIPITDVAVEFPDLRYHDDGIASTIIGTVRATSGKELAGLDVTCAAFQDGSVVGGGHDILSVIPEGEEAGIQARGLQGGMTPDELRCSGRVEYLHARVGALDDELVVQSSGFSVSQDQYTMAAMIENPTDQWAWALDVAFDMLDASGRVIGSEGSEGVPIYIAPHGSVAVVAANATFTTAYDGPLASLRVLPVVERFLDDREIKRELGANPADYEFAFSDVHFGELGSVTGTITSHSRRSLNALDISCTLVRNGVVVAGAVGVGDEGDLGDQALEPDAPTTFDIDGGLSDTGADSFECTGALGQGSDV